MHEVSIVEALIEQVRREVDRSGQPGRVTRLDLVIGRFSGVNADSIRFAFRLLAPGTLLESARLEIAEPKAECLCRDCHRRGELDEMVGCCPYCGSPAIQIQGGQDLLLQSIELEE